ncbi:hypothetical protein R1sor_001765 [Riccia sorocarpa]|uniref:CCHC-type domain-containing protein n=1 Tax=Riccia sorocarpa TaxID=122646 RepID=A0ABD3GX85_9MARC
MVFLTPSEPGHNPQSNVGKKMPVWLDLLNVDPMLESESKQMLATLGPVIHQAGVNEGGGGKFPHIRGCVLMDINKPLPTVLKVSLNGAAKLFGIHYDTLPDACYTCHQRGHFQRFCPLTSTVRTAPEPKPKSQADADGFHPVPSKGGNPSTSAAVDAQETTPVISPVAPNPFQVLATNSEDEVENLVESEYSINLHYSKMCGQLAYIFWTIQDFWTSKKHFNSQNESKNARKCSHG